MGVFTYETLLTSPVANATVQKVFIDGFHKVYYVTPNEGYALHCKHLDTQDIDLRTYEPIGEVILGYKTVQVSVSAKYDFDNVVEATIRGESGKSYLVSKIGEDEFYTIPADEVSAN